MAVDGGAARPFRASSMRRSTSEGLPLARAVAGTARRDGALVTAGGRVLGVQALGRDVRSAVDTAYAAVERIRFEGAHYRRDIARRALAR